MKQSTNYLLPGGCEERPDGSNISAQAKRLAANKTPQAGRTRPTNNQLLYRAIFHWQHYRRALSDGPKLPESTEACASVTSAFLQVVAILFEVEKRREIQPRNVLRLLATNTRRTKVVELSSGTHRVPEELKRHSIQDGEGGHYSTNLDRNRYSGDDQYLATVVRYNLDYLDLCPCLVEITILDAKGGNETTSVTADPSACTCNNGGVSRMGGPADARQQRRIRTIPFDTSGAQLNHHEQEEASRHREVECASARDRSGALNAPLQTPASTARTQPDKTDPGTWSKNTMGSDRFTALLEVTGTDNPKDPPRKPANRTPSNQFARPRRSPAENDSMGDSEARLDRSAAAMEPLRRSNRKAARRFNAKMDDQEWEQSDNDQSSFSGDDDSDSGRRDKALDRRQTSNRLRKRRASNTPLAPISHGSKSSWQQNENRRKRDFDSLQDECWHLRQQLNASEQLLDASRKQQDLLMQQVVFLQGQLQDVQAVSLGSVTKDKSRDVASEAARRLPNGNLGLLPGIGSKEAEALTAKLMSLAQATNVPLPYSLGGQELNLPAPRNGEPANLQVAAQNATNAQLQAVMRGSSAFSQLPFPQASMLGFGSYPLAQTPPSFDIPPRAATPNAPPKSSGDGPTKPTPMGATPSLVTPARLGTMLKPQATGPSSASQQQDGLTANGTPTSRKGEMDDRASGPPIRRLREDSAGRAQDGLTDATPRQQFHWSNAS